MASFHIYMKAEEATVYDIIFSLQFGDRGVPLLLYPRCKSNNQKRDIRKKQKIVYRKTTKD